MQTQLNFSNTVEPSKWLRLRFDTLKERQRVLACLERDTSAELLRVEKELQNSCPHLHWKHERGEGYDDKDWTSCVVCGAWTGIASIPQGARVTAADRCWYHKLGARY